MIIWLASYPKSGNTWLRSIISSLIYTENGIFDIKLLDKIGQFPLRKYIKNYTNKFNDINEISKYWIPAQNKINLDNQIKFLKTHNLLCTINNNSFTDKHNTLATIYVVRDPRNLVSSISNHFKESIEGSTKFLSEQKIIGIDTKNTVGPDHAIATLIGTWKDHYNLWTKKNSNLLIIKYEDLINNIEYEIDRIITFLKEYLTFEYNEEKKNNIIKTTKFENLSKLEDEGQFKENVFNHKNKKIKFFNKGPRNNWENTLSKEQRHEIEEIFKVEMKELNYL